ncbi:hypothetical protein CBI38_02705 [Rhodococcus oxybenzonivorans]|uniref:Phage holin family protein n=1 Tax=Rhodococcus oxybenzonivorans TaxID=1990687 RepID=A0A2S2BPX6_9NOCA|nr:phage holin family protein [Rhodococcus oxybenzonivorans]AWK70639.1 hypothetical protein CBI38_02705 [Rhodococcus oxybenzonivorans]
MSAPYGSHTGGNGTEPPSIGELLSNVSEDLTVLMRQEVALAKAEATQTANRVGKGAGMLAGAAVAAHFAVLFLSVAAWWSLGNAIGRGWSALVVMLVWAIIAAVLAVLGRAALKKARGLPQTTDTAKKIPDALTPHPQESP